MAHPPPSHPVWKVEEIERLLGVCRAMRGRIGELRAGDWWQSLVLLILDTQAPVPDILAAPASSFGAKSDTIGLGMYAYRLHERTRAALRRLTRRRQVLLPWPRDQRTKGLRSLRKRFARLVRFAGLSYPTGRSFSHLARSGSPELLDQLDECRIRRYYDRARRIRHAKRTIVEREKMHTPAPAGSLRAYYLESYSPMRLASASARHREENLSILNVLRRFAGREVLLDELSDELVERFMAWGIERKLSPATVNKWRSHLLAIWSYAFRRGRVDRAPRGVDVARCPRTKHRAWSLEEVERILTAARQTDGAFGGVPARLLWPAFLLTLFDTGMRVGAALQLAPADYTASTRMVFVRAASQKGRNDQYFLLHTDTAAAIAATKPERRELLFPFCCVRSWIGDRYKHILKQAGLPHGRYDLFHKLRRTNASHLVSAGASKSMVQTHLGHTALSVTERYIDSTIAGGFQAVHVLPRPGGGQRPPVRMKATPEDPQQSIRRFVLEDYIPTRLVGAAAGTKYHMAMLMDNLAHFAGGRELLLEELSDELVERFMAWGIVRDRSPATANQWRGYLLAVWRHAWRRRKVETQPRSVNKLRMPRTAPRAYTQAEFSKLLHSCALERGTIGGVDASLFWLSLVLFIYDTGLRISAAMETRTSSLDLVTRWLLVPSQLMKNRADQMFRLHTDTIAAMAASRPESRELLFPWPHDRTVHSWPSLNLAFRKILKRAGLPTDRKCLFHKLRRTSASHLAAVAGRSAAQSHLGHSAASVTEAYLDPRIVNRSSAADVLPRPFLPNPNHNAKDN